MLSNYICIYIYTHTHTHIYIYIYITAQNKQKELCRQWTEKWFVKSFSSFEISITSRKYFF